MPKRVLNRIRLDKIAAVGKPCQEGANATIIKRAPTSPADAPPPFAKKTFEEALHGQLVGERISEVFWRAFDKQYAVREAFRDALADELSEGGDGSVATEGFTAAMRTIAETAATLAREAGADADTDLESAVEQAVEKWLTEETSVMKITTKAALKAAVAAFDPSTTPVAHVGIIKAAAKELGAEDELPSDGPLAVEKADPAVANLQKQVAVLSLTGDVRKHYEGLAADKQDAFLAKSVDDQAAEVAAANATDPVVYKTAGGIEIRKSDGSVAAMLAKQMDEQAATIVSLTAKSADSAVEARATAEFPNVAKATAVAMLKSAQTLGVDTDAGKDVVKALAAMNKAATGLFKRVGSDLAPEGVGGIAKARSDFNSKCTEIAKRDGIGSADAMSKASLEYPDLFAEAYPDTAAARAEAEQA